ncbi:hypothetical protein [Novosphingobium sp. JCM 18896]|nr:hypothetical protein [Novosphingobium sp. JCM 18896]MCW1429456.1 hypothetical protein [Novosphingobium sp. JCM 18896]
MARVIALTRTVAQHRKLEALRMVIVSGCALALILAGQAFPL